MLHRQMTESCSPHSDATLTSPEFDILHSPNMVASFSVLFAAGYLAGEKLQGPCRISISTPTAFHEHAAVFNKADSMAERGAEKKSDHFAFTARKS